jgi:hypothetical protein
MAQQTAVEWFAKQAEIILIDLAKNNNTFQLELCLHELNDLEVQAKEMEKQQIMEAYIDGYEYGPGFAADAEHYYTETYGK